MYYLYMGERTLYIFAVRKKTGPLMWMENVMIRWILKFLPIYFVDSIHHSSKWQSNLQQRNQQTNTFVVSFYSFLDLKGYDHFLKCEHHFYYPSKLLFENEIQTKEEMSIKNFNWKRQSSILNTDKNKRILQELSIWKAAIFYVK